MFAATLVIVAFACAYAFWGVNGVGGCTVVLALLFWYGLALCAPVLDLLSPPDVIFYAHRRYHDFDNGTIALTFDDVPSKHFGEILTLLAEYNQKATFFVISSYVTDVKESQNIDPGARSSLLAQLTGAVQQGHELANHGSTNSMHALQSRSVFNKQLEDCETLLDDIYAAAEIARPTVRLFRPGCGILTPNMLECVRAKGMRVALGSVHGCDPFLPCPLLQMAFARYHIVPGTIAIFHDLRWTPALLRRLLPWMQKMNITSRPVHTLIL